MSANASPIKKNARKKCGSPQADQNLGAESSAHENTFILSGKSDFYLDAEAYVIGALVAVVETPSGKPRRRIYLTLAAAEKSVLRARMNGHRASVVLCKLIPMNGGEAL